MPAPAATESGRAGACRLRRRGTPAARRCESGSFSSLAGTVATHAAALSPTCANVLCDTLTDLLALAIGPSVRHQESARTSLRRELMRRTCAYVE